MNTLNSPDEEPIGLSFTEIIDGVEIQVEKGLDGSKLTFPDGTVSIRHDDGRVVTLLPDGGMDVIDPLDGHSAHHSAAELDIDAIPAALMLRASMPFPEDDEQK